jgi:3-dehydroquinate dehydratase I
MVLLPVVPPGPAMATTLIHSETPSPAPPANQIKASAIVEIQELANVEKPALLVLFGHGQKDILGVIADVLGQAWKIVKSLREAQAEELSTLVGVSASDLRPEWEHRDKSRIILNTHCIDGGEPPDEAVGLLCDYEYLYSQQPFDRRDLARFLSFVFGQISPHRDLSKKSRTTLISTTFPDVHKALPNLEILSVGADAVELRVDLLEEPLLGGGVSPVPSLKYVGEQVMTLRRKTELPIIYTTRCTNENGRFPMQDPALFEKYLMKAIQWGCEYIDVELWLPAEIRERIAARKGNSKIISAFHDFSRTFKWTSPEAQELFAKGAVYGDVVKMIVLVSTMQENYELEYFRSTIEKQYAHPPLSGLNMGPTGQLSRTLNKVFTPITHPLLPRIAAPGQLSAAEINHAHHTMGQMPKLDFYGIGSHRSQTKANFFEKCFNELSLPHQFIFVERAPRASVETIIRRPNFGGAYLNPPLAASAPYLPDLSDAARATGQVDTIVVRSEGGGQQTFVGDNASWKGIRSTLSRDFVPSAYGRRAALLLANHEADATPAMYALKSLGIGPIYTIGFKTHGSLALEVTPVRAVEDLKQLDHPFVILSALPADKSLLVGPLLKHYSTSGQQPGITAGKVFVDLANGPKKGDPMAVAQSLGWTAYGSADVNAWTTVETMRLLVGQNVPYDFVRLASGRSLG